jgi:hypothetical protein
MWFPGIWGVGGATAGKISSKTLPLSCKNPGTSIFIFLILLNAVCWILTGGILSLPRRDWRTQTWNPGTPRFTVLLINKANKQLVEPQIKSRFYFSELFPNFSKEFGLSKNLNLTHGFGLIKNLIAKVKRRTSQLNSITCINVKVHQTS